MPKRLSPQQVQRFHGDGFLAPVRVLSEEQTDHYRGCLEAFETRYPQHVAKLDVKAYLLCPWVNELVRLASILDVIEDLIGPNVLCASSNFRVKQPDGRSHAGWHQDGKYIRLEPDLILIIVAFNEHTTQHGCLRFIPGSHRWCYLNHSETNPDPHSILDRQQHITDAFDDSAAVNVLLKPGEMSIHQPAMVHSSAPNCSKHRRIAWIADYLPTHARAPVGHRQVAMLVRGVDEYHHFEADPVPSGEASSEALAAWKRSVDMTAATIYEGSEAKPLAYR